ncbi:FlgB family protein [Primorskyibacter sp. S187A]|uniref:FlgB family protein n=1 Tax=Primorskyibacter sp. S187A TaxID=3415130 RepID=UPI003C7A7DF2
MFENLELFRISHAMARHAGERQALVARNMANSDTPGFTPKDLSSFSQSFRGEAMLRATRASHLNAAGTGVQAQVTDVKSTATSPNGNGVSVEEEMLRAVDVKRQHDRALAIYRHSMTVLRASIGRS